jgi:hypothetical protein
MAARVRQGQSIATVDKERRIAAAMSVSMRIANKAFGRKGYRYWHFDANAGNGWNHEVGVPGSPMVFWHVASTCLPHMEPAPFFCDRDAMAIEQLRARLGHLPAAAGSFLLPYDNEAGLTQFAATIRISEKPHYAVGSLIIDPNGYYYRNAKGIGAPIAGLQWFVREFPRIDIILNLNMRTFHLQRGSGHAVATPASVLASLNRKHWLVSRAGGQSRHLLAVGRNMATGDHKALGLYDIDSDVGRKILNVDAKTVDAESDLFGETVS